MSEIISVALATYNGEKYIREQIKSILNQNIKVDEIVICDDCSSDRTIKIIEDVLGRSGTKYKILLHEQNKGVTDAFFDAIEGCTGDIVFLSDQDDVWLPQKVDLFLNEFHMSNCCLCFSDAFITDSELKIQKKSLWEIINFFPHQVEHIDYIAEMVKRNIFTGMCMAFRKKQIMDKIICSNAMLHDELIGWTALMNCNISFVNEKLVLYRQHAANVKGASKINFNRLQNARQQIMNSNNRYLRKFRDILANAEGKQEDCKIIIDAMEFYKWKCSLVQVGFVDGFLQIFKHVKNGTYRKFTTQSDHAVIKDLILTLY